MGADTREWRLVTGVESLEQEKDLRITVNVSLDSSFTLLLSVFIFFLKFNVKHILPILGTHEYPISSK